MEGNSRGPLAQLTSQSQAYSEIISGYSDLLQQSFEYL